MAEQVKQIATVEHVVRAISSPLFLKFAEYLGYETPLIKWVDKICEGKDVPKSIETFLKIDAKSIFDKMQSEYTIDELVYWWDAFYPVVMAEAEFNLISKNNDGNLPF